MSTACAASPNRDIRSQLTKTLWLRSCAPEEEFVFGPFTSPQLGVATQVSIRSIAARISFGNLAAVDPLAGDEEGVDGGGMRAPLEALEHIRFFR